MVRHNGKVVKSVRMVTAGHYNSEEWVVEFTDGSSLRFCGTSSANVEMFETRAREKKFAPAVDEEPPPGII